MNIEQYTKLCELVKEKGKKNKCYISFTLEIDYHAIKNNDDIDLHVEVFTEGTLNMHKEFPSIDKAIKFLEAL